MTSTLKALVDEVFLTLEGWGLNVGRAAFLSAPLATTTGLTFTVGSTENLSPGLAELSNALTGASELIYIQSVNDGTLTVTISPDGRGYRGTSPTTYATGDRVTMNPIVPRSVVKRTINETIVGLYPKLYAVAATTITPVGSQRTYELPLETESILEVNYQSTGPTGIWPKVEHYDIDLNADALQSSTGKSITLLGGFEIGQPVKVTYRKRPTELVLEINDITSAGLNESARSVILAGTLWRIASRVSMVRLRVDTTGTDVMDNRADPVQQANQAAAFLRAQYEFELAEEMRRQAETRPATIFWKE